LAIDFYVLLYCGTKMEKREEVIGGSKENSPTQPDFEDFTYYSSVHADLQGWRLRTESKHGKGFKQKKAWPFLTPPPLFFHLRQLR